uniref:Uncharacterized protein n=1 Tax=Arundo donax TaxID=35708 RepID=A0A0A9DWF0_ARUDO
MGLVLAARMVSRSKCRFGNCAMCASSSQSFLHSDEPSLMSASSSGRVGIVGWLAWSAAASTATSAVHALSPPALSSRWSMDAKNTGVFSLVSASLLVNSRVSQLPAGSSSMHFKGNSWESDSVLLLSKSLLLPVHGRNRRFDVDAGSGLAPPLVLALLMLIVLPLLLMLLTLLLSEFLLFPNTATFLSFSARSSSCFRSRTSR